MRSGKQALGAAISPAAHYDHLRVAPCTTRPGRLEQTMATVHRARTASLAHAWRHPSLTPAARARHPCDPLLELQCLLWVMMDPYHPWRDLTSNHPPAGWQGVYTGLHEGVAPARAGSAQHICGRASGISASLHNRH